MTNKIYNPKHKTFWVFQFFTFTKSPVTAVFTRYRPLAPRISLSMWLPQAYYSAHASSKSSNYSDLGVERWQTLVPCYNNIDSSQLHVTRLATSPPSHNHHPKAKWGKSLSDKVARGQPFQQWNWDWEYY